ncbi:MAG: restriction endonuclease subunit S [Acinetobacter sp.]|nr:MAG: restriction endonuclease subunit S [Acinetobacter sp.]
MTTPKLRFKEFDGDWAITSLYQLSTKIGDGIHATPKYDEKGTIPFINGNNLVNGSIVINENTKRISVEEFQKYNQTLSDETLFLSINGTIGNLAFYKNEKVLLGKSVCFINLKNDIDKKFIYLLLQSPQLTKTFNSELTGTTIKNLSLATVRNSEFYCPIEEEQTKIASFLSAVDEKISQLTQKHELLSQYKQGMMQQLFSQQIRFKADDGSEFGEWEEKELKEVAEINPKAKKLPANFIYIDLESVEKGQLLLQKNIELQDAPSRAQRLLAKGDVLFQMVRPYQQNNYYFNLSGEYVASTGYAQIRTKLDSKFIYYALHEKTFLDEVMNRCTGTSYPAINSSDLSSIEMFVPCLEEQTKIANFLSAIDQKIEVVAQQIQHAKLWKKGLLQQMFV